MRTGKASYTPQGRRQVAGLQATAFSETLRGEARLQQMLLPRLLALAERAWAADPAFVGRPQHRLSGLLGRFAGSIEVSVCDTDRYPSALDRIATAIEQRLQVRCIQGVSLSKGTSVDPPVCLVGDAAIGPGAGSPPIAFPVCGAGCCQAWARSGVGNSEDPAIQAACGAEPATCYCAVRPEVGSAADKLCKEEPGRDTILGVWRRDPIPPGTALSVQCLR